ncbi:MAG TPA: c-type cytochrome [Burkholderiales bacterium]|nr:c-type cytochrome [Burkholderiales bacterium]
MKTRNIGLAAAMACLASSPAAAADAARGAQVFHACAACHSVNAGEHMTGPSLARVWDRKAGSAPGFQRYSDALKSSGIVWTRANLERWLADPERTVPGTSMTFPGLENPGDREDVIAYLRAVSENKAPAAKEPQRGMMMSRGKADLKRAPPEGQVTAIARCGDTYTVRTADGKAQKVWEFNLRFKTDSSKDGPRPGKPVIVGAGMQGDRASVVFADPSEISPFVKQECK